MSKKSQDQHRARYTLEFKLEAVRLVKAGQEASVRARVLGMPKQTLSNWVRLAEKGELQGAGVRPVSAEQMELAREAGVDGTLWVVLAGFVGTEHRQHAVAGVLKHFTEVRLDDASAARQHSVDHRVDVFRVELPAQLGRADDVEEENRDLPELLRIGRERIDKIRHHGSELGPQRGRERPRPPPRRGRPAEARAGR